MLYGFDKTKRLDASAVVHTFQHAVKTDSSKPFIPWTETVKHIAEQSGRYVGLTKRGAYDCAEYLESLWRLNINIVMQENIGISSYFAGFSSLCPKYTIENKGGEWLVEFSINDFDEIEHIDNRGTEAQQLLFSQDEIKARFDFLKNKTTPISYEDRLFAGQ